MTSPDAALQGTAVASAGEGGRPKAGVPTMILFGTGFIANSVMSRGLATFLMVYYNQVMGLPAAWVGLGTGLALLVDAVVDPGVGYISDHVRTRWGRRHPFMYAAAAPVAILFFLLWNPPSGLEPLALFTYMMACLLSIRVFDTLFELPASALVPELVEDYDRRTLLFTIRVFLGVVGGLLMTIFAYQVLLRENPDGTGGVLAKNGYASYGLAGAIVIFLAIMTAALSTHRFIPWLRQASARGPAGARSGFQEIRQTLGRRSFVTLTISGMLVSLAGSLTSGLTLYVAIFYWGFSQGQLSLLATIAAGAAITGLACAPYASRRLGKRDGAILGYILGAMGELIPYIARLAGLIPPNGDPWVFRIVAIGSFVNVASWSMTGTFLTAMVADIVEDSAVQTGRRAEGLLFAADSLFKKISGAGGPALAGLVLTIAAFPVGAKRGHVPEAALRHLMLIYLPTLMTIYAVSITALAFYNINRQSHAANLRKLSEMSETARGQASAE
jgi:GPH family glycoside/pentoside/hexuronide:cation symporter